MKNLLSFQNIYRFGCLIFIFIMMGMCLFPCFLACPVERDFQDWELIINETDLPTGWVLSREYNSIDYNEGQNSGADHTWVKKIDDIYSQMWETIYHYSCGNKAFKKFQEWSDIYIPYGKSKVVFFLEGYDLSQFHANAWKFGCDDDMSENNRIHCTYIAQYDEFMLVFSVFVKEDGLDYISRDELYSLLMKVDWKMSSYLDHNE